MMYHPKPIKSSQNNTLFADLLIAINVVIVFLNYQENKRNVKVAIENVKISKEISMHLKKINTDGIIGRLSEQINKGDGNHGNVDK